MSVFAAWDGKKTDAERKEDGFVLHAGMDETSMMLAMRPDLVDPGYKNAKPFSASNMEDLILISKRPDWRGYFGAPRLARAEKYDDGWRIAAIEVVKAGVRILDGADDRKMPRMADELAKSPPDVELDRASLRHELQIKRKQEEWLRRSSARPKRGRTSKSR